MILALDVGNTQIFGGVYDGDEIKASFRKTSKDAITSDELGVFLIDVLRANSVKHADIKEIGISSVVPDINRTIANCCKKYFNIDPFFISADINSGMHAYGKDVTALGLGADRIATGVAAMDIFKDENLIVIDFGTANTFDVISKTGEYKGGAIQIGIGTALKGLVQNTAQLSKVEILDPKAAAGLTTETQLQAGLYYGNLGAIKEFVNRYREECYAGESFKVIATGGMARMFEDEEVIDLYEPDLVLRGIKILMSKNK
ncbi:type III pantothenate kinase [Parelusimicrobium proximum]|uniref:type III pantothenate kinase n=1 Tax=Parelusimicrobium proximum TaxID=3228953 RepID=UPI003D17970F